MGHMPVGGAGNTATNRQSPFRGVERGNLTSKLSVAMQKHQSYEEQKGLFGHLVEASSLVWKVQEISLEEEIKENHKK